MLHEQVTFDTLFLLEFLPALLLVSPPSSSLLFTLPPPLSFLLHFSPTSPSHSFLPLFAFAPQIHFLCQLLPFLCHITLPHSPCCVCLTAKNSLGAEKQGSTLTFNSNGNCESNQLPRCCPFLEQSTATNIFCFNFLLKN